mgnify:CR=1 FL=1
MRASGLHCTDGYGSICSVRLMEATVRVCAGKDNGKAAMLKIVEGWDRPESEEGWDWAASCWCSPSAISPASIP